MPVAEHPPTGAISIHLVEWINGGDTSLANSALLCERHHSKVHHGFRVHRDPAGRWHTYRPDDTEITLGTRLSISSRDAGGPR